MKDTLIKIIEILLGIAIIAFLVIFFLQSREYKKGGEEYAQLSQMVSAGSDEKTPEDEMREAGIPVISVDYEGLLEKNPDFIGWLYLPGLSISYPVVQGEDDEFYLHHTFEGEENTSGCVFMEALSDPKLEKYNSFLYGHNMKNGTMFGSLKRYVKEDGLYNENPEFYLYTPEASYKYVIYSYYITSPKSHTYFLCETDEEYEDYQKMALEESAFDCKVEPDVKAPTLTLATCSGTGANKQRLVVHGLLSTAVTRKP